MLTWLALFLAGVAAVALVVAGLLRRPVGGASTPGRLPARVAAAQQGLLVGLTGPGAALAVLLAGVAAVVALLWPLGVVVKALQPRVDVPLFRFARDRQGHPTWTHVNDVLTLMGNRPQVKLVCVVSAVVLALVWRRRAWWLPPVVIAAAFGAEKYGQKILTKVVARGHPPTTLGSFPSGGCARLIAIYGVILYVVVLSQRRPAPTTSRWLFGLLALAAYVEGYTRIYLLKHWFTDVVAGWLFGSLLLFVLMAATTTLARGADDARVVRRDEDPVLR